MFGKCSVSAKNNHGRRRCPGRGIESPLNMGRVLVRFVYRYTVLLLSKVSNAVPMPLPHLCERLFEGLFDCQGCLGRVLLHSVGPESFQPPVNTLSVRWEFLPVSIEHDQPASTCEQQPPKRLRARSGNLRRTRYCRSLGKLLHPRRPGSCT